MPLFSDHLSNMYYSGSPSYTSSPYSYSSAASPFGSSYSASYLNPGGNYSSHSSLGGYSRTPLSSRWLTGSGRTYSPILSTISEKGTSSPVRLNSPRRIPIASRSYVSSPYTSRPININTADIDVSRDKYRSKVQSSNSIRATGLQQRRDSTLVKKENEHNKPDTGIDTSPGAQRPTIKRDRTVVRLHTVKRKERDSPRKPIDVPNNDTNNDLLRTKIAEKQTESKKWREKLADDLTYKTQREKKTLGAKLVEKFTLKEKVDDDYDNSTRKSPKNHMDKVYLPKGQNNGDIVLFTNKSADRRCSVELLAEQASLLDSLIRRENLSTAPLDLSKVGVEVATIDINLESEHNKKRKLSDQENRLATTKSDHSLHDRLSSKGVKDPSFPKRKSLRKCSSGSNLRKLDCIKELPKKTTTFNLSPVKDVGLLTKNKNLKPKMKTKITSTVEVTTPSPQLKFIVENVTVEEKSRPCKKDIIFTSTVDEKPFEKTSNEIIERPKESVPSKKQLKQQVDTMNVVSDLEKLTHKIEKDVNLPNDAVKIIKGHRKSLKSKPKEKTKPPINNIESPEPEDGNFWEKIGKRETVYLIKRKENLEEAKEQSKRSLFWFPEEDESNNNNNHNSIVDITNCHENTVFNLLDDLANINVEDRLNLTNKSVETLIPKEENKILNKYSNEIEDKKDVTENIGCEELKDVPVVKEKHACKVNTALSHVENKDNDLASEKVLTTLKPPSYGNEVSKFQSVQSKLNESSKSVMNYNNEPHILVKLKDSNKNGKPIESNTEDTMSSKIKTNQVDSLLKSTKDESTSTDIQKLKPVEQLKNAEGSNCFNLQSSQNLEEASDQYKMDSLTSTNNFEITQGSIEKNNSEISSAEIGLKYQETKKSSAKKDNKNYVFTNSIEIRDKTTVIVEDNGGENLNVLENKIIQSSTNKSLSEKNTCTEICNVVKEKAKKQDALSNSSNVSEKVNAEDENIHIKINQENALEPIKISENVEIYKIDDKQDSEAQREKRDAYIEETNEKNTKNETGKISADVEISSRKSKVQNKLDPVRSMDVDNVFANMKPAKEEKAVKPLIATPRPLQKRNPQTIRSSSSSESSDDDSSDEDTEENEEGESGSSHGSTEFLECEINPDGRTSTGSNDSGFDSSAPTSPSGFLHTKKDCDVNCHRKCEKLTANLCGVNQRLLVEALASRTTSKRGGDNPGTSTGTAPPQTFIHDILEQELEHSTAYDLFRKTGRFTPPARSIPRFRKYTIEDFQFIRVLGKGSFGKVMLAELRDTEYYYAVKCLKKDVVLEDDDVECTLIERKVLALGTNHPYLCHLFATFQTDSHLFFVMEYLNGGDLMFHIQQSGRFQEVRARFYAAEIVSGLKFLHKRGIVYRDLKLDNILLDFDGHVRIADFGMCKLQIYLDKTADTFCGTPDYMAPEIIKGLKYNQTVDWWSFGVLLYEMLIGQSPFSGCDEDELFWSICNEMPSYPRFLSKESLSILTRLLDKDAKARLGGPECMHGDIRDQEFFKPIQWDRLERRELEAPFKPRVRHPMDTQYFDRAFTGERPRLTAVEPQVLRSMDQEPFRGFSYTNPNATDR